MNKNNKQWFEWVSKFDLPEEIILGMPLLMFGGNRRLYIENHQGLLEYSDTVIRLRMKQGQIVIKGEKIFIEELFAKEIFIVGIIHSLDFDYPKEG